jgi:hypothetical protein
MCIHSYQLDKPPLGFHPARQYRNALVSKKIKQIWEKENLWKALEKTAPEITEPPLQEVLWATLERLFNRESFAIGRMISLSAFFSSAFFLFLFCRSFLSSRACLCALSLYLLHPFAVVSARSLQPESFMMLGLTAGIFSLQKFMRSSLSFPKTAAVLAFASLIKPGFLLPFFTGGLIGMPLKIASPLKKKVLLFLFMFLPAALWIFFFASGHLGQRLFPELFFHLQLWKDWLETLEKTFGTWFLCLGLPGIFLIATKDIRIYFKGLLGGYFLFFLLNNHTASFLDHYHLQLFPLLCVGSGVLFEKLETSLKNGFPSKIFLFFYLMACLFSLREARLRLLALDPRIEKALKTGSSRENEVAVYGEIASAIPSGSSCLLLSYHYGLPLIYHTGLKAFPWISQVDLRYKNNIEKRIPFESTKTRFKRIVKEQNIRYFLVQDFQEWEKQEDLKKIIESRSEKIKETPHYILFEIKDAFE